MATNIVRIFNDHFIEFVDDIIRIFPDDADIVTAKNCFILMRKANPKLIIRIWKTFVVDKYEKMIDDGDISFFIEKDYAEDFHDVGQHHDKIIEAINRLRNPVKLMNQEEQAMALKYLQNLKKISCLYKE